MASRKVLAIKPAINACRTEEPPLDFTFMCLASVSDCLDEEPRAGKAGPSGLHESDTSSSIDETTRKHDSHAIRLSNNAIQEWTDFSASLDKLLVNPLDLEWIDLSFNDLKTIDKCLLEFTNLKVINLHGNGIEKISEVDKLYALPQLKSLTLHGNPMDDLPGYRHYIIARIPQLQKLDFSLVTKQDRASSQFWQHMNKPKKGKNTK